MKFLLIAAALNLQVVYGDLDTCNKASEAIKTAGHEAISLSEKTLGLLSSQARWI